MINHKKFAVVASCLLVVSVLFFAASIVFREHIPDDYIGAQRAYLSALERQLAEFDAITTTQRIALIGSSPVIMGLSAEQIETATGVPTRNLAMDASRSVFGDYAAMVIEHIRPGDVVIIGNPNLRKLPQMELPLTCVKHFGFECIRAQSGLRPRIVQDALVLFTDRAFGYELLPRTPRGDLIFPGKPQYAAFRPKFIGSFPRNGADNMAKFAADVHRHRACPIFVLTPLLPERGEISLWQREFTRLWREIDEAGLHDIVVQDFPLWNDQTLFHHDEHMSERGREVWISKCHRQVARKRATGQLPAKRCAHLKNAELERLTGCLGKAPADVRPPIGTTPTAFGHLKI